MIPLNFGLFWAGDVLSYLRYLTFKSLRHHHPNAKIQLYLCKNYNSNNHKWQHEGQDFEKKLDIKNYLCELSKLNIEVINVQYIGSPDFCPVFQSDLFRWIWMKKEGGIYLDTDQIILKPFDTLPLNNEFIYCRYMEPQCGDYYPIGVLALEKDSEIADIAINGALKAYNPTLYNSSGPMAMHLIMKEVKSSRMFNAPSDYFYPIYSSCMMSKVYNGHYKPNNESYALHWFGGLPLSQKFNQYYTEYAAARENDSISKIIREQGLI